MRLLVLAALLLLSACASTGSSAIDVLCAVDLPTVSRMDTDQTIIEVDNFSAKFRAACDIGA